MQSPPLNISLTRGVITSVQLLNDTKGSLPDFQDSVAELRSIESTLNHILLSRAVCGVKKFYYNIHNYKECRCRRQHHFFIFCPR